MTSTNLPPLFNFDDFNKITNSNSKQLLQSTQINKPYAKEINKYINFANKYDTSIAYNILADFLFPYNIINLPSYVEVNVLFILFLKMRFPQIYNSLFNHQSKNKVVNDKTKIFDFTDDNKLTNNIVLLKSLLKDITNNKIDNTIVLLNEQSLLKMFNIYKQKFYKCFIEWLFIFMNDLKYNLNKVTELYKYVQKTISNYQKTNNDELNKEYLEKLGQFINSQILNTKKQNMDSMNILNNYLIYGYYFANLIDIYPDIELNLNSYLLKENDIFYGMIQPLYRNLFYKTIFIYKYFLENVNLSYINNFDKNKMIEIKSNFYENSLYFRYILSILKFTYKKSNINNYFKNEIFHNYKSNNTSQIIVIGSKYPKFELYANDKSKIIKIIDNNLPLKSDYIFYGEINKNYKLFSKNKSTDNINIFSYDTINIDPSIKPENNIVEIGKIELSPDFLKISFDDIKIEKKKTENKYTIKIDGIDTHYLIKNSNTEYLLVRKCGNTPIVKYKTSKNNKTNKNGTIIPKLQIFSGISSLFQSSAKTDKKIEYNKIFNFEQIRPIIEKESILMFIISFSLTNVKLNIEKYDFDNPNFSKKISKICNFGVKEMDKQLSQ